MSPRNTRFYIPARSTDETILAQKMESLESRSLFTVGVTSPLHSQSLRGPIRFYLKLGSRGWLLLGKVVVRRGRIRTGLGIGSGAHGGLGVCDGGHWPIVMNNSAPAYTTGTCR